MHHSVLRFPLEKLKVGWQTPWDLGEMEWGLPSTDESLYEYLSRRRAKNPHPATTFSFWHNICKTVIQCPPTFIFLYCHSSALQRM